MKSRDFLRSSLICLAAVAGLTSIGCGKEADTTPPMATPSLTLSHDRAPAASPLELTYKFVVPNDAHFTEDYRVFVHIVDTDEEQARRRMDEGRGRGPGDRQPLGGFRGPAPQP